MYEFLKGDVRLLHVDAKSRKHKARTGLGSGYRSITRYLCLKPRVSAQFRLNHRGWFKYWLLTITSILCCTLFELLLLARACSYHGKLNSSLDARQWPTTYIAPRFHGPGETDQACRF